MSFSKKRSLAEQLALLSTPAPASFHPDEDDLADLTAAKVETWAPLTPRPSAYFTLRLLPSEVCDFEYDEGAGAVLTSRLRRLASEDPRYAGRTVGRREALGGVVAWCRCGWWLWAVLFYV